MAKMFILLACLALINFDSSNSATFRCNYGGSSWDNLGFISFCDLQRTHEISALDSPNIDNITNYRLNDDKNDDVNGLSFRYRPLYYIPRGLDKFFKNLKVLYFYDAAIKEIRQSDLKVFPNLVDLKVFENEIEILEENLFEFNPNLEVIWLSTNRIAHIHPNVFDKLTKLRTLNLDSNACINIKAENDPAAVQNVIKAVKAQCTNADYANLEEKFKNFEIESKSLNAENFKEKIENLENEVKKSKFRKFFQKNLQDLKAAQVKKAEE